MTDKPRIVVFDSSEIASALTGRGLNAYDGTFGGPFKVPKSDRYTYVPLAVDARGLTEADLVVANLASADPHEDGPEVEEPAIGVEAIWSSNRRGVVDPRAYGMASVSSLIDRIFDHGGVVILIAAAKLSQPYVMASQERAGTVVRLNRTRQAEEDNWCLCRAVSSLRVETDGGVDMTPTAAARELDFGRLEQWQGRFRCTLEPDYRIEDRWVSLAKNKYDRDVAGVLCPASDSAQGWLFVLPPLDNIADVVGDLIERRLPKLAPQIFPPSDDSSWLSEDEYEHDDVRSYRNEIVEVRKSAEAEVLVIEQKLTDAQAAQSHLHTLLTGSGDELVAAVIKTIESLGFLGVIDADQKNKAENENPVLREDIHVAEAGQPLVLGEVKGIHGLPSEEDSLQVVKYLAPRMRELKRTDIRGLTVVNHQRGTVPLDRNHATVFQDDVIVNAEEQSVTLLTSWELFRIARNAGRLHWSLEAVRHLFYTDGRPDIVPSHYSLIGSVDKVWPQREAIGVTLTGSLTVGRRIAVEGPVVFSEIEVDSIQVHGDEAEKANAGDQVGITWGETIGLLREGQRVFVIDGL